MIINTHYRCGCAIDLCPCSCFSPLDGCGCNHCHQCFDNCNCGCGNWQTSCPCQTSCFGTAENAIFFLAGLLLNKKCLH
ncbi:MAG: hypothetical protein IJZ62_00675 [Clostridia bacterium]|nr:hypothetical protein [Clostridia bacterium]